MKKYALLALALLALPLGGWLFVSAFGGSSVTHYDTIDSMDKRIAHVLPPSATKIFVSKKSITPGLYISAAVDNVDFNAWILEGGARFKGLESFDSLRIFDFAPIPEAGLGMRVKINRGRLGNYDSSYSFFYDEERGVLYVVRGSGR